MPELGQIWRFGVDMTDFLQGVLGGALISGLSGGLYVVFQKHIATRKAGDAIDKTARAGALEDNAADCTYSIGIDGVARPGDLGSKNLRSGDGSSGIVRLTRDIERLGSDLDELRSDVRRRFNRLYARTSRESGDELSGEPEQPVGFDKLRARAELGERLRRNNGQL